MDSFAQAYMIGKGSGGRTAPLLFFFFFLKCLLPKRSVDKGKSVCAHRLWPDLVVTSCGHSIDCQQGTAQLLLEGFKPVLPWGVEWWLWCAKHLSLDKSIFPSRSWFVVLSDYIYSNPTLLGVWTLWVAFQKKGRKWYLGKAESYS